MKFSKCVLGFVAIYALALSLQGFSDESLKAPRVRLEYLSNGLAVCVAEEEDRADQLDINMMIRFDEKFTNPRERILASLMKWIVNESLEKTFESHLGHEIVLRKPQMFTFPNLVLYGMDLTHPTQQTLDDSLILLSHLFANVMSSDVEAIETKLEKFFDSDAIDFLKAEDEEAETIAPICQSLLPILSAQEIKNFSDFYYRPEKMMLIVRGDLKNLQVSESIKHSFSSCFAKLNKTPFRFGESCEQVSFQLASNMDVESLPQFFPGFRSSEESETFEDLSLNEKESKMIEKLMHTLATANFAKLIWKQRDLEKIGKSINHVHPLKFISHIVSEPILRSDLQEVHRNFFKWKGFMDGFRRRMTEEFYKGNLEKFLPGFCETLDIKQDVVEHFIERRDWEGLVRAVLF